MTAANFGLLASVAGRAYLDAFGEGHFWLAGRCICLYDWPGGNSALNINRWLI